MARKATKGNRQEKVVDPELVAKALAKAVSDGDVVNFKMVFMPFSPARAGSSERFEDAKYAHLLPEAEEENHPRFREALALTRNADTWAHVQKEIEADRPAQLPSSLLIPLGDNALRLGKYTSAAQAYELLRIRQRMQDAFFEAADRALDAGEIPKAVRAYVIATGLDYNYAAFPEPLPTVPNFHTAALMLHGEYPKKPEDCVALQEPDALLRTAFGYLLHDASAASRLEPRPLETRVAFLKALVAHLDPQWDSFIKRYREACGMVQVFAKRFERAADGEADTGASLADEIAEQTGDDPRSIAAHLLGRTIPDGEWWQYLKELAYTHPAAALFVSRQMAGEHELLIPRYRGDSPIAPALGLVADAV
jgi:hypothetical protein